MPQHSTIQFGREAITHCSKLLGTVSVHYQICCFKSGIMIGCLIQFVIIIWFTVTWMSYRYSILNFGVNLRVAHILYLWHLECYSICLHHWFAQWCPLPPQFRYKLCLVWSYPFRNDTSFNSVWALSVIWNACPNLKFISSHTGFCNTCHDTWENQQILCYSISCFW
jgi:hypothetical protein